MKHEFTSAHEYAEIFPLHDDIDKLQPLVDDIKKVGQRVAILLFEGKVLDGLCRERACFKAGRKPKYKEFKGTHAEALALSWSLNFPQRHLGEGERALCAARYAKAEVGANQHSRSAQNEPTSEEEVIAPPTNQEAADKFKVSKADVKRAKVVNEHGCEALQNAVSSEEVSLSDAASIAKTPHGMQVLALEKVKSGECKTLVAAIEAIKANKKATAGQALCDRCKILGYQPECYRCAEIAEKNAKLEMPPVDDAGEDVPEELKPIFATVDLYLDVGRHLTKLANLMKQIETGPTRHKKPLDEKHFQKFYPVLKDLRRRAKNTKPAIVCKGCVGKNCTACRGHQWLSVEEVEALKKGGAA